LREPQVGVLADAIHVVAGDGDDYLAKTAAEKKG
jgi:hypothetical protein